MVETKYTKEYLEALDRKNMFVPLVADYAFKYVVVRNPNIFKKFLISTLRLDVDEDEVKLELLGEELFKSKKREHGKTVDLNVKIMMIY